MTQPPAPFADVVTLFAMIGGLLFASSETAQVVAPYAAIFFSSMVGAMWSLARRESDTTDGHRWRGAKFMTRMVGTAMILTVPAAIWLAPHLDVVQPQTLLAPVAALIGAVGDDWKPFLLWCRDFILRWKSGTSDKSGD